MSPTMRPLALLLALAILGCMPPQDEPPFLTAESAPITSASPECVGGEISYVTSGDGCLTLAASAWEPSMASRLVVSSVDRGTDLTIDGETCAVVTSLSTAEAVARVLPYMLDAPLTDANDSPLVYREGAFETLTWCRTRDGGFRCGKVRIAPSGQVVFDVGCGEDEFTRCFWWEVGEAWQALPLWARTRAEWRLR